MASLSDRMQGVPSSRRLLWRYNRSILAGGGYWVIVLPVAASQVVTLWMMALATDFNQRVATHIAELMAPILGAFLVAHALAPEYRSGVGAVLACKPVSLHRVVTMRVGLAMLAAALLTFVTLAVCSVGLHPIDVLSPMLASLPSLWFLSLLALTFATLFRNSLAGFSVAAGLWALDLGVGYAVHPLFSLQGLHARLDSDPLASGLWVPGKIALLAVGSALLWLHGRLLPRICRPAERKDILAIAAAAAAVLVFYCVTGGSTMVVYAYTHRANLPNPDVIWLRRQLKIYEPVPVARLFGPAFATYVADPPPARTGGPLANVRVLQLRQALARWPGSMWADGIAFAVANEEQSLDERAAMADYFAAADQFGGSPFAPKALVAIVRSRSPDVPESERLRAARRIIADYPQTRESETAANLLLEHYPAEVRAEEMLGAAQAAEHAGLRFRRPGWLVTVAQMQLALGRNADARASARQARAAAQALFEEHRLAGPINSEVAPHRPRIAEALQAAEALLRQQGESP
jgi:hypothetical protein